MYINLKWFNLVSFFNRTPNLKVKTGIHALYRSEWLDTATFVFISACINCGHTAEEGVRRFQRWMNLEEDQLDTDSLKTSFYRSQRKFRKCMHEDRQHLQTDNEIPLLKKEFDSAMKELKTLLENQ